MFCRVRRRRKWEEAKEKRAKLLQSSSVYSSIYMPVIFYVYLYSLLVGRQNLIIHFSLTSGTCVNAGWTLHPDDVKKLGGYILIFITYIQYLELQAKKPRKLQKIDPLPDDVIAQLSIMQPEGPLLIEKYSSGHLSVLILPDKSGQYQYPSPMINLTWQLLQYSPVILTMLHQLSFWQHSNTNHSRISTTKSLLPLQGVADNSVKFYQLVFDYRTQIQDNQQDILMSWGDAGC